MPTLDHIYPDGTQLPDKNLEGSGQVDRIVLGNQLGDERKSAINARGLYEERWLADLRQYKGVYPPLVASELKKNMRSTVYYRLTTFKVNTTISRLMDLLFPQKAKNWSIIPTPDPDVPEDIIAEELSDELQGIIQGMLQEQVQQYQAVGAMPDEQTLQAMSMELMPQAMALLNTPETRHRVATIRANRMEKHIDDALKECNANGQRRPSWQQNCRSVVTDATLYGMGILKGPLVEQVETKRFVSTKDEFGNPVWEEQPYKVELRPYHEAVSIWDVFPDPDARNPSELRYVWQSHLMSDKDVLELMQFPGFDKQAIEKYIRDNRDGDAHLTSWEASLRELDFDRNGGDELHKRYRVWERWGFLTGQELAEAGADIPEDQYQQVFSSNVWMIGENVIIKAFANPLEGVDIPYYWYPYQNDDSSFWPEGVASLLRHPQAAINAAVRAMQDNMAFAASPFFAINVSNLSAQDQDHLNEALARKMFLFDRSSINLNQAFQAVTVPSCTHENLQQKEFWSQAADEISTPRFNAGDGSIQGAGETASGLSMLMGASNIILKDHIKLFDDCIIAPFLRAMFRWMMQWSDKDEIKGDFEIVPTGSMSLVAKEVRAQQIPVIMQWLSIPQFAEQINMRGLLEVAFEQTDLPSERILFTEEEAERNKQEMMMQQAMMQAQANVQAMMEQLQKQGLTPEQINQQMIQALAMQQAQRPETMPQQGMPEMQPAVPQGAQGGLG